jgi:hypothetical protein
MVVVHNGGAPGNTHSENVEMHQLQAVVVKKQN